MNNRREMVEFAAKAIDYLGLCSWDDKFGYMWDREGFSFDPLGDSDDALMLARMLGININFGAIFDIEEGVEVSHALLDKTFSFIYRSLPHGKCPDEATRELITEMAAELGQRGFS